MQESFELPTVVLALLAAFVIWKVRSILGTRSGDEHMPSERPRRRGSIFDAGRAQNAPENESAVQNDKNSVAVSNWVPFAAEGSELWLKLDRLVEIDPLFSPREFLDGAKAAYEMILIAFSSGDRECLEPLLSREVFESFTSAISAREVNNHVAETTLISIGKTELKKLVLTGTHVQIIVSFNSKLITAIRDTSGTVIEGSLEKVVDMTDVWTFSRDTGSPNPNWRLVSTGDTLPDVL